MARENQGLQIALIVFVILTIILGGTTYLCFSQYKEADQERATANTNAGAAEAVKHDLLAQIDDAKRYMGFKEALSMDEVQTEYEKDMKAYSDVANVTVEGEGNYRDFLGHLVKKISDLQEDVELKRADITKLTQDSKRDRKVYSDAIGAFTTKFTDYKVDVDKQKAAFSVMRKNTVDHDLKVETLTDQTVATAETARIEAVGDLDTARGRIDELAKTNEVYAGKIRNLTKTTFKVPDGQITYVDQAKKVVFINLGRADGLARQVSFAVYPSDTTNLSHEGKKASIEVTKVLSAHTAEARITDDSITDPILPSDKIHTVVWSPGERKQFALTGLLDIDGDDKSDLEIVRNVITMNGGIVDCWLREDGQREGEFTPSTQYLVLGTPPAVSQTGARNRPFIDGNTAMRDEAKQRGMTVIKLEELLKGMGFKSQTPVERFGRGGNSGLSTSTKPKSVPRVSTGGVSKYYDEEHSDFRKRSGPGGAY